MGLNSIPMMKQYFSGVLGSKLPLFSYGRDRGLYTHYKDSLLKGGMSEHPQYKELRKTLAQMLRGGTDTATVTG